MKNKEIFAKIIGFNNYSFSFIPQIDSYQLWIFGKSSRPISIAYIEYFLFNLCENFPNDLSYTSELPHFSFANNSTIIYDNAFSGNHFSDIKAGNYIKFEPNVTIEGQSGLLVEIIPCGTNLLECGINDASLRFSSVVYLENASNLNSTNKLSNDIPNIKVFPNPTKSQISITSSHLNIEFIEIFDAVGKVVQTKILEKFTKNVDVNLNNLSKGTYFLKINCENKNTYYEKVTFMD